MPETTSLVKLDKNQKDFEFHGEMYGDLKSQSGNNQYALWRDINGSKKTLLVCGLFPKKLSPDECDEPSTIRLLELSKRLGFGRLVVVNLFSIVSNDWKTLKWEDHHAEGGFKKNDETILRFAAESDMRIAAWGNNGRWRNRGKDVYDLLRQYGPVHCVGINSAGHPMHSVYVGTKNDLVPFDYVKKNQAVQVVKALKESSEKIVNAVS